MTVFIYADEACLGNQNRDKARPGGLGLLVEIWQGQRWHRRDLWLSEPDTTNNRMAIRSATEPLRHLKPSKVIFTSDSQYLIKGASEWIHGWVRRGWTKAGRGASPGEVVANTDLWKELLRVAAAHQVDWRWVKGHAGHPQNEWANWLATSAAAGQTSSGGFVESQYDTWIHEQIEVGAIEDFNTDAPPPTTPFQPCSLPGEGPRRP